MEKFFIVGCPRSGTTMVQQALNRHSQIAIPPETKFFFSFFGQPRKRQFRHIDRLNTDLKISLPKPKKPIRTVAEGRAFFDLMAQSYVERLPKKNVVSFGEKTPEHTGHLPRIWQLFPNAKVLVLHRDGRDVASSLTRMPWMSSNVYVNFTVWLYYHRVLQNARNQDCSNMYFARYEDIVATPEKELAGILRFLGLPYEPAVAQGCGNREGIPERENAWKERALRSITTERVGAFRRELTGDEIEILERLGRDALPSLGYKLLTGGNRPLSAAFLLNLSFHLSRFVYRLPWYSIVKELFCRFCPTSGTRRSSPAPFLFAPA